MRMELWHDPLNLEVVVYSVLVKTAEEKRAGTDARVHISIIGETGESRRQRLLESQNGSTMRLFSRGKVRLICRVRSKLGLNIGLLMVCRPGSV